MILSSGSPLCSEGTVPDPEIWTTEEWKEKA